MGGVGGGDCDLEWKSPSQQRKKPSPHKIPKITIEEAAECHRPRGDPMAARIDLTLRGGPLAVSRHAGGGGGGDGMGMGRGNSSPFPTGCNVNPSDTE